jgi:hypothetical protein
MNSSDPTEFANFLSSNAGGGGSGSAYIGLPIQVLYFHQSMYHRVVMFLLLIIHILMQLLHLLILYLILHLLILYLMDLLLLLLIPMKDTEIKNLAIITTRTTMVLSIILLKEQV